MVIPQEILNKLRLFELDKRRNKDYAIIRRIHNEKLKDIIEEMEVLE